MKSWLQLMDPKQAARESVGAEVAKIWCLDLYRIEMCNFIPEDLAPGVALLQ